MIDSPCLWTVNTLVALSVLAACNRAAPPPDDTAAVAPQPAEIPGRSSALRVVFLGNSITAGYGLDPSLAFPALIQARTDSIGWPIAVVNAGLSGETTAGGLTRLPWLLQSPVDILVLELGANDGLRGIDPEVTRENLQRMIRLARAQYPEVVIVLAGMQVPPNLGATYADALRRIYPELQKEMDTHLIPFILAGVGGNPVLNLQDGIHPNAAGHRIISGVVWETLAPLMQNALGANP